METTDYVSYPIALALKKAGFDWKCDYFYGRNGIKGIIGNEFQLTKTYSRFPHQNSAYSTASAPTLAVAQKWLREKKGVLLWVYPDRQMTDEEYSEIELTGEWWWDTEGAIRECSGDTYPSYEQAISAGIEAVLELIEKKGE